jgi:hypothetical protein
VLAVSGNCARGGAVEVHVLDMTGGGRRELKPGGCVHFWELEPARESESEGVCRYCEERKTFSNREVKEGKPSWRYGPKLHAQKAKA